MDQIAESDLASLRLSRFMVQGVPYMGMDIYIYTPGFRVYLTKHQYTNKKGSVPQVSVVFAPIL